jgi:heme-degrading monooxygenase HmoA
MILEVAVLQVRQGQGSAFEKAFAEAQATLSSMDGYVSHQLHRCIEVADKYVLLVHWRQIEDHTVGFRRSAGYQKWKQALHHFYDPFPVVEHFEMLYSENARQASEGLTGVRLNQAGY